MADHGENTGHNTGHNTHEESEDSKKKGLLKDVDPKTFEDAKEAAGGKFPVPFTTRIGRKIRETARSLFNRATGK